MIIKTSSPKGFLKDIVREYYFIHLKAGGNQKQIPIIDDCCYDFIFFKEAKASFVYDVHQKRILINAKVFTVHDLKPPYKISFDDTLTFFTIKLQPWVNGKFFSQLKGKGIMSLESDDEKLSEFYHSIFSIKNVEQKFLMGHQLLSSYNNELSNSILLVKSMCQFIEEKNGIISVIELSEHFNKSRQYLNRVFKKEVLYTLKQYITTVRIVSLVKYKSKNNNIALTAICYDYGYFDQSHFIADFKKVCGVTPTHFFNNLPEFMLRH